VPTQPCYSWYLTSQIEVLTDGSNLREILWNFSRYPPASGKRVTLAENPHFYRHHFPITSPNASLNNFTTDPTEHFLDADDIYVLTNKPGRVYLESNRNSRAFDNVWTANEIYIFKGHCLAFLLFPLLKYFQTSMESSTVKVLSFKAVSTSGVVWILSVRFGNLYRTGERQSSMFYIHKIRYALRFLPVPYLVERIQRIRGALPGVIPPVTV
jgi:hypothetical protein